MPPHPAHRLPAPLETAVQRLKLGARGAVERTIESLGLAALGATQAFQRDALLEAQFELNRKAAQCVLRFNEAFDQRVLRELGVPSDAAQSVAEAVADFETWDTLALVDNEELEAQIWAERFGMDVAADCDWELREFNACAAALLQGRGGGEPGGGHPTDGDRNPLRPEVLGHALAECVQVVSERADTRQLLQTELSRSLRGMLRETYASIMGDLRKAGVQPLGMALRGATARAAASSRAAALAEPAAPAKDDRPTGLGDAAGHGHPGGSGGSHGLAVRGVPLGTSGPSVPGGPRGAPSTGFGHSTRSGMAMGQVDPGLMALIRRIAEMGTLDSGPGGFLQGSVETAQGRPDFITGGAGPQPPNLIHVHREALRQASNGSLDHLVIDVIAGLFDQILSDPKVPPQLARQIGRLQLPVLRAALGDSSFFSSRRHPVRRFVNRIASLGASFEDIEDPEAQRFLAKVKSLVQQVLDGDFERVEVYEAQLQALEAFVAELAREGADPEGRTAELLAQKEDELRLRQLYAQRLQGELQGLAGPAFVRDFLARTWSQVLLQAAAQDSGDGALTQRLRLAGRDLFMSVQPKTSPGARKTFLADLPRLMQDLTAGLDLIGWPQAQRNAFFGQLMPAHAEALKTTNARPLDINLLARQVDQALQRPLPSAADLAGAPTTAQPLPDDLLATAPAFSDDEARRVGLVPESAVNWALPAGPLPELEAGPPTTATPAPSAPAATAQQAAGVPAASDGGLDIDLDLLGAPSLAPASLHQAAQRGGTGGAASATSTAAGVSQPHGAAGAHTPAAVAPPAPAPSPAEVAAAAALASALPADTAEAPEPTQGRSLADHVQIGFAYQMQLDGQWQKVRLAHVSAGRSFFVFTHGSRHTQTVSLTRRMLVRLCEAGRLRAFETAALIERASERARRQLAALGQPGAAALH